MKESEAREKWCPFARVSATGQRETPNDITINRYKKEDGFADNTRCIASDCMMWRESTQPPSEFNEDLGEIVFTGEPPSGGYCGLAK